MTVATDARSSAVRAAVATVDDPELPGISIVELGLLESALRRRRRQRRRSA